LGLSKRIIENRTKPLPEGVANRLNGFNGNMDQLLINLKVGILKEYLQEEYGPVNLWNAPLQRLINGKDRFMCQEVEISKNTIRFIYLVKYTILYRL